MPAPTVVSTSRANGTGSTVSVSAPASITAGNLLLAFSWVKIAGASSSNPPTGWTTFGTDTWDSGGGSQFTVFYKVATNSEPGSYTFNGSPSLGDTEVEILNISGAASSPEGHTFAAGSTGTSNQTGSLTTAQNNELLVAAFGNGNGSTITLPGSLTPQSSGGDLSTLSTATGTTTQATAGNTGTFTATDASSGYFVNVLVSVPPPGAGSGNGLLRNLVSIPPLHPTLLE
jgi:hypothetical protein